MVLSGGWSLTNKWFTADKAELLRKTQKVLMAAWQSKEREPNIDGLDLLLLSEIVAN
jgi:hypothetical protein